MTDRNMELAIRLAEAGLYVFPCGQDKKPLVLWRGVSTNDPEKVRRLWAEFPFSLPAIDMQKSGLLAMDGDRHGGPDGVLALELLFSTHDFDPRCLPGSKTPGNGVHVYFRQNGSAIRNERGDLPGGIDVRGEGGYVIAPGALLSDGRQYEPMMGSPDLLEAYAAQAIPYVPQWLVDILRPERPEPAAVPLREATRPPGNREEGYARAAMDQISAELSSCPGGARNESLNKAAFRLGTMIARGWIERGYVEDRLADAARACGLLRDDGPGQVVKTIRSGLEAGLREPHAELEDRPRETFYREEPNPKAPETGVDARPGSLLLSAKQFVKGFTPPDYVIDGIVQRGYLYSLTARTGHGKTAVSLFLAQAVARGLPVRNREVKQGSVLILAGENPDDIRARFIVLADAFHFVPENVPVHFLPGVVKLAEAMPRLAAEAARIPDLTMVIVDTAAAYFPGDDSNSNAQQGEYARLLRQLTFLPGKPAALVNCHPIKNAMRENLVPLGGGAFLNEVDGNLTLWNDGERQATLHWQGKFRGPEFEAMAFKLDTATSDAVKDSKGRHMPSVVCRPMSDSEQEIGAANREGDENILLGVIGLNPTASIAALARKAGWVSPEGEPYKSKVFRLCLSLRDDKLLESVRGKWRLTGKGKREIGWGNDDEV